MTRFCANDGEIPAMTARVQAANHLGHLLVDGPPREDLADQAALASRLLGWESEWSTARFTEPMAHSLPPGRLTDFQTGFYEMARRLREAALPGGHP